MENTNVLLDIVQSPADLKKLSLPELPALAAEIRKVLIDTVAETGGHLASNLGVVELTIALHYVFSSPKDKIVWDIGHQGYVHKLLTGRREFFRTLRNYRGCLGFLSREESEHDCFGAGHAGTAVSAALGMAVAAERRGSDEKVVAVIGDGALSCGIALEGLNNVSTNCRKLMIILNDNKMSISENVGAISSSLNRIISGRSYNRFKALVKTMLRKISAHHDIGKVIRKVEDAAKGMFLPGAFFEELGLRYIGPLDGHDLPQLIRTLSVLSDFSRPLLVHVITEKGRGYEPAENAPEKFHGLAAFNPVTGESRSGGGLTFSAAFGAAMQELAARAPDLAVITAGMAQGTGLTGFSKKFPGQFYDVGIAEEHAVVFAGGLAAAGLRPVVALYVTFMQRALDCVFHDVCLQNLPVIFCLDRAGVVEDGPTHHGIYDLGFFRGLPNLTIMAPKDENELRQMIFTAYELRSPVIIRYPRGGSGQVETLAENPPALLKTAAAEVLREGRAGAVWAMGPEVFTAQRLAARLAAAENIDLTVVNMRFLCPFDAELLSGHAASMPVFTLEDGQLTGGLASAVDEILINVKHCGVKHFGWKPEIIPHGAPEQLRARHGLDTDAIMKTIIDIVRSR
ncbi:MAG: 1-deoxy-D-xylulose-5-phosphate synthase [Victivallaceae bacterium]|nr:1-deoxy-D-xylulose-5-phosphate synthase [Victivallaceae bacterium]